jgi:hypothetical protein
VTWYLYFSWLCKKSKELIIIINIHHIKTYCCRTLICLSTEIRSTTFCIVTLHVVCNIIVKQTPKWPRDTTIWRYHQHLYLSISRKKNWYGIPLNPYINIIISKPHSLILKQQLAQKKLSICYFPFVVSFAKITNW